MIQQVLPTIIHELNSFLKRQFHEMEDKVMLSGLVNQDGSMGFSGENKVICGLFNIEQEQSLLNVSKSYLILLNIIYIIGITDW